MLVCYLAEPFRLVNTQREVGFDIGDSFVVTANEASEAFTDLVRAVQSELLDVRPNVGFCLDYAYAVVNRGDFGELFRCQNTRCGNDNYWAYLFG